MQTDTFAQIAGYTQVKEALADVLACITQPKGAETSRHYPRRILLYGPPGTGKSQLAQQLIEVAQLDPWYDVGSVFFGAAVNDGLNKMKYLFDRQNALIILDELDYLVKEGGGGQAASQDDRQRKAILDRLLLELESVEARGLVFIAIANRTHHLDSKFWQLMDRRIEVPLPDFTTRRDILAQHLAALPLELSSAQLDDLAGRTVGSSGRQLARLIHMSSQAAAGPSWEALLQTIAESGLTLPHLTDMPGLLQNLDEQVSGQVVAKRKLCFAASLHYTNAAQKLEQAEDLPFESNVLLIGPEGLGKEQLAGALAKALKMPFARLDAMAFQQNPGPTLQTALRELYEGAGGDTVKAEHGIIYIEDLDKLCDSARPPGLSAEAAALAQNHLLRLMQGQAVELNLGPNNQHQVQQFQTGSLLFIAGGDFAGLEDKVRARLVNPDPAAEMLQSYLLPQDLASYGLLGPLVQSFSALIPMESWRPEELLALMQAQWGQGSWRAYQQLLEQQGLQLEMSEDGWQQLAQEVKSRKLGLRGLGAVIRDLYSYIWMTHPAGGGPILLDKVLVAQAMLGRDLSQDELSQADGIALSEVPDVSYAQIGGLADEIGKIKREIEYPYLYAHIYRRYNLRRPKGILLFGPPGTGKTMIAKAIANSLEAEIKKNLQIIAQTAQLLDWGGEAEPAAYADWVALTNSPAPADVPWREHVLAYLEQTMGITADQLPKEASRARQALQNNKRAHFLSIKGPQLANKYVGETESKIRQIFAYAKARASATTPVIIFFDEIEALFGQRGTRDNPLVETVVPAILAELDGMESLNDVIVIGATNRPEMLDPALTRPGRMDIKIPIPRPGRQAAKAILQRLLPPEWDYQLEPGLTKEETLEALQNRLLDLLYADKSLIRVVGHKAMRKDLADSFPWRMFISGAILASIVNNAARAAALREIHLVAGEGRGLAWADLKQAAIDEFEQNKSLFGFEPIQEEILLTGASLAGVRFDSLPAPDDSPVLSTWATPIDRPWEQGMLDEIHHPAALRTAQ
jgi:SpoVK/Ycf46/Vps4 family AAA+-type ATPase